MEADSPNSTLLLRQPGLFQAKTSFPEPLLQSEQPQLITQTHSTRGIGGQAVSLGYPGHLSRFQKASLLYLLQKLIWQSLGHVQNLELEWGPTSS